jgi:hypothetical protein
MTIEREFLAIFLHSQIIEYFDHASLFSKTVRNYRKIVEIESWFELGESVIESSNAAGISSLLVTKEKPEDSERQNFCPRIKMIAHFKSHKSE